MSWECHRGPGSIPSQQLFSGEGEEELHAERVQVLWRIVEGSPLSTSAPVEQVIFLTSASQSCKKREIIVGYVVYPTSCGRCRLFKKSAKIPEASTEQGF
jgi:hypothetical protein